MADQDGPNVDALQDLTDANRVAREVMVEAEELLSRGIEQIRAGVKVTDAVRTEPVSSQRLSTREAMERVEVARNELRLLVIAECVKEGMVPREVAELWGMSRQRADQYVQQIRRASRT